MSLTWAYFASAWLTVTYTRFEGGVAFIWIGTSFLLAGLVTRPKHQWPALIVGCGMAGAIVTTVFGIGLKAALPLSLINIAEAVVDAIVLRRLAPRYERFESLHEIMTFLLVAGIVMPATCGLFAALTVHLTAGVPFASNWLAYLSGHGLGAVTVTPLLMLTMRSSAQEWLAKARRCNWAEVGLLCFATAATSILVFSQDHYPLLFLPLLPIMISVFRLGRVGAAGAITILTLVALTCTISGHGPISLIEGSTGLRAQFLQFYLACSVVLVLPMAAELAHRKKLFAQLQSSSAVARLVLDRTGDIIMRLEVDGTMRYISPSIEALAGYRADDLVGLTPHDFIHPDDVAEVVRIHRLALASPNDTFIIEYRARKADGIYAWYEVHTRATVDEQGDPTGVVSIIREISSRKIVEDQLAREALTDPLTGLLNRRALDTALDARIASAPGTGPFTVVMFDLDHFKSINDRFGHAAGDTTIRAFARLLENTLREGDVIARYGGEEFVVLLDGADSHGAHEVCERLRVRFAEQLCDVHDGRAFRATVSGGIASFRPGMSRASLLEEADAALYSAKANGRNRLALAA